MNREEARIALDEGKKVRHFNFTSNEYLVMEYGRIMTEDGYFYGDMFYANDWMEDGWSIVEEKEPECLMDIIERYPDHFIDTCHARAGTTPSMENRKNHLNLAFLLEKKDWKHAAIIVAHEGYRRPLNGVVICLRTYSNIPYDVYHKAVEFERQGKLV